MRGLLPLVEALPDAQRCASLLAGAPLAQLVDAGRHGLSPLLWHCVEQAKAQPRLPAASAERLKADARGTSLIALRTRQTLVRVLEVFAKAELPALVLKGWPLAVRLYPRPELRATLDVDVLVPAGRDREAMDALARAGGAPAQLAEADDLHHHWPALHGLGPAPVELHRSALVQSGAVMDPGALFERAERDSLDGWPFLRLCREDQALYLAAHAAGHFFGRLGWLVDLKLLAAREPPRWEQVAAAADATGFRTALDLASALLARVGGPAVGHPPRLRARALAAALSRLPWDADYYAAHPKTALVLQVGLADSPLHALRFFWPRVVRRVRRALGRATKAG